MNDDQILKHLKHVLPKGKDVYTRQTRVSRSGMTRWVRVYIVRGGGIHDITWMVSRVLEDKVTEDGIIVHGCNFSAQFDVVHRLSYTVHGMRKVWCKCRNREYGCKHAPGHTLTQRSL